jgi:hypothetical protein
MIATICCISDRPDDLLPHYFQHYANMEIDRFYFGLYGEENGKLWDIVRHYGRGLDLQLYKISTALFFDSPMECNFKNQIIKDIHQQNQNNWYVPTDLDEFVTVDGYSTFPQLSNACISENADFVASELLDRITTDGTLPSNILSDKTIWDQFPRTGKITTDILGNNVYISKVALAKSSIPIRNGHHYPGYHGTEGSYKPFSMRGNTHHFKWFGALSSRELLKYDSAVASKFVWAWENSKLSEHIEAHGGKLF